MGKTSIEWTDYSWNPIRARNTATGKIGWHCEHKSEGCRNCYAEVFNRRLGTGLDFKPSHRKDVEIFLDEKMLRAPLGWKTPRKIFVGSMTDVGADFVTDDMLDRIFAIAALCPQHTFIILTKRPERMREYFGDCSADGPRYRERAIDGASDEITRSHFCKSEAEERQFENGFGGCASGLPLANVWLGTSCEDQDSADERIPHLLATPAAIRFLSCEPLLGPIDLLAISLDAITARLTGYSAFNALTGAGKYGRDGRLLHWVIVGGETGPRPMHPDWVRSLRDQCAAAGVPFFFKQWGEWAPGQHPLSEAPRTATGVKLWGNDPLGPFSIRIGKKRAGRLLDGVEHNGFPEVAACSACAI